LFFFLCIALGVGSVVALRSLIGNVTLAVGSDARELMTADLEISSASDFAPSDIAAIEDVVGQYPTVEMRNETITTSSMASPADPANETLSLVELKGIEPPFPLVGVFTLDGGQEFDHTLLQNNGALVARILLDDLNVRVGDKLRIGEGEFEIRGSFDREPGGSSGFRLGPRVFVEKKAFDDAGITRRSGRVRRRILYRTSDNPTQLAAALREALKGRTINVRTYRETQERLGEQFARTENYLSLSGLLVLVLGGVGVWNVSRAFVEQKRRAVAILKCLGAGGDRIITVYLLQILVLGFVGSLFGIVFAQAALLFVQGQFATVLPENMSYAVGASTAAQGILLGVLISMLFSALPLLQIRNIKPRLLLHDENNTSLRRLDISKWVLGALSLAGLLLLAVWQAGSALVGLVFLAGLAVTSACLIGAAMLLTRILRSLRPLGTFAMKQGINSLYRPGNQTRVILLAVGLGAFVVLAVQSLQTNLVRELDLSRNARLPTLFFIDIQKSQIDEVASMLRESTGEDPETTPTVRARIAFVNGKPLDFSNPEVRQMQGQIGREFAVTYRPELDENETVIAGRWWNESAGGVPEVSVEKGMAERLGVIPGDSITFDISGRKLTARAAGIREIDLRNTRTAFVFVFRPGALENAPQSYAATILSRLGATDRQRLQRDVVRQFPNVQVFDVAEIVAAVQSLVNNFVVAVSFVGSFVALSGILILIGSVALTKSQRVYENAILKTLGADRRTLASVLVAEYGMLGTLAGIIGAGFATVLSFVVSRFLLGIEWVADPLLMIVGTIVTIVVVLAVGLISNFDVLFRKPLSILRSQ
jgi:putative ABC transport system permease protein